MAPSLTSFSSLPKRSTIVLVHLVERRRDVGRRGGIAAQFLQRHQDLVGAALRAADIHLLGLGRDALGADEVLVQAGIVAADVAQGPGDVGVDRPAGRRRRRAAPSCRTCSSSSAVTAALKTALSATIFLAASLRGFRRAVDRLVDGLAQRGELDVQRIDAAADGGAVVERAGQRSCGSRSSCRARRRCPCGICR